MVRSQIQLTEEQFRSLKTASARTGKSMAELIRQAVDRFVSSSDIDPRRRERAIASIGGFRSGRRDVSERHDDQLADAYLE